REGVASREFFRRQGLAIDDERRPSGDRRPRPIGRRRTRIDLALLADVCGAVADRDEPFAFVVQHVVPSAAGTDGRADRIETVIEIVAVDRCERFGLPAEVAYARPL